MNRLPTLLVLAHGCTAQTSLTSMEPNAQDQALHFFNDLHDILHKGLESGLPILLVAPKNVAEQARTLLPGNCVVELTDMPSIDNDALPDSFARAVVTGVLASAQANGWLLLPAHNIPILRTDTLGKIAQASAHQPVVFPQYKQVRGHPIRFSSEFFSELIRLQSERDIDRLVARYPAEGVDVDDPGVLLGAHDAIKSMALITKPYSRQYI